MSYRWFGYDLDDTDRHKDNYYEGHKKGYAYDGHGYYTNLRGGSDLYYDEVEHRYMHTM